MAAFTISEIIDCLAGQRPFNTLSEREVETIADTFQRHSFDGGSVLVRQDQEVRSIGLIGSGFAERVLRRQNETEIACGTLGQGEFFGIMSLVTAGVSNHSVICKNDCICYLQSRDSFLSMVQHHPPIRDFFYHAVLKRLHDAFEPAHGHHPAAISIDPLRRPDSIERAITYIDAHFFQPLDLKQVAQESGLSPFYFSRIFKVETGFSFKSYLNFKRVKMAKTLMRKSGLNVSEACFKVGYNDVSYFSRVFRKIEGISPSTYRKCLNE